MIEYAIAKCNDIVKRITGGLPDLEYWNYLFDDFYEFMHQGQIADDDVDELGYLIIFKCDNGYKMTYRYGGYGILLNFHKEYDNGITCFKYDTIEHVCKISNRFENEIRYLTYNENIELLYKKCDSYLKTVIEMINEIENYYPTLSVKSAQL